MLENKETSKVMKYKCKEEDGPNDKIQKEN